MKDYIINTSIGYFDDVNNNYFIEIGENNENIETNENNETNIFSIIKKIKNIFKYKYNKVDIEELV